MSTSIWSPDMEDIEIGKGQSFGSRMGIGTPVEGTLSGGRSVSSAYDKMRKRRPPSSASSSSRRSSSSRGGARPRGRGRGEAARASSPSDFMNSGFSPSSSAPSAPQAAEDDNLECVGTPLDYEISMQNDNVPPPDAVCFSCKYASTTSDGSSINHEGVKNMVNFMHSNLRKVNIIVLAKMASEMFEREVRGPANRNLQPGDLPLPKFHWTTIIDHLRFHTDDAELNLLHDCRTVKTLAHIILKNKVYRLKKGEYHADGSPMFEVDSIGLAEFLKTKRLCLQLRKSRAKDMAWFQAGDQMLSNSRPEESYVDTTNRSVFKNFPRSG
jgi:hypothetical protein